MNLLKGWLGEMKTTFFLWLFLDSKIYRKFHNIIIPSRNGTTQIDHLIVSPFGVFIIETKNYKGWIYGSEGQALWTKTLYQNKYTFQNPLRQTYRQKKVISEFLGLNETTVRAVIYFVGDCKFKTQFPANVIKAGLGRYIKRFRNHVLSPAEVYRISEALENHKAQSSLKRRDHVRSLRERHASKTVCPRCGSNLVERTAKNGPNAGSKFLGCADYPRCRFSKNV